MIMITYPAFNVASITLQGLMRFDTGEAIIRALALDVVFGLQLKNAQYRMSRASAASSSSQFSRSSYGEGRPLMTAY